MATKASIARKEAAEKEELQARLDKLEKEVASLKREVNKLKKGAAE